MKRTITQFLFLLCFSNVFAQALNNGPVQLQVRVRDWDVTLAQPDDYTLNTSFVSLGAIAEDEYTFKIWARASAVNTNWYGGSCYLDEFDPSLTNSVDYNDIFYNQTFAGASVPQYFDLRIDCHEDDMYDFSYYLSWAGGLSPCSNLTNFPRCTYDVNACCAQVPFFGCLLTESDDLNCNANTFSTNIDYQAYPPCQWHDYGYIAGSGCSATNNIYRPHIESYWRYTNGTGIGANAIDLGVLTAANPLYHFNSNQCYNNNWAMSGGNDVFYKFTINQPMGVTASLCGNATFNTVIYVLDNTGAVLDSNDNFCNLTSRTTLALCAAGTYYVVVDAPNNIDQGTFTLNIQETPNILLKVNAGADALVCSGNNLTLGGIVGNPSAQYGQAPYIYSWYPATGLNATNVPNPVLTPTVSNSYILYVTDSKGCTIADTVQVNLGLTPIAGISANNNVICSGTSATFTGTGGVSYQWLVNGNVISGATSSVYNGTLQGGYNVVAYSIDGCPDTSSTVFLQVVNNAIANANVVNGNQICTGQTATLVASGLGLTYQWLQNGSPISGATSNIYQTTTSGNYQVIMSYSGQCADTSLAVPINVVPLPTINLNPSGTQAVCQGTTVPLNASGSGSIHWFYNGASTGTAGNTYNASQVGTYYALVTDANGCENQSANFTLTHLPQPIAAATAAGATSVCQGNTVTLVGSGTGGNQTYQWLQNGQPIGGATQNVLTTANAGNYQIVITENTCDDTSNVVGINIMFPPSANISPAGTQNLCGGSNLMLNASGGTTYQWYYNSQPIQGATSSSYNATQAGIYYATVGDINGCTTNSVTTTLTFLPVASAQITPTGNYQICQGDNFTLLAGGGNIVGWMQNGVLLPNTANLTSYNVTNSGFYQVIINGVCNSDTSSMTTIGINPLPTPVISPTNTISVCEGKTTTLQASGGNTYQWFWNGQPINGATTTNIEVGEAGLYYATVTNSVNCTLPTDVVSVSYNPLPVANAKPLTNTVFCEGNTAILLANGGDSYQWLSSGVALSNGNDDSLLVNQSGTYQVIAQNGCGKDTSAVVYIETVPVPIANFYVMENPIYPNTEVHFIDSSQYAGNWNWSFGDATGSFSTQNPSHNYNVVGDYPVILVVSDGTLGCVDTFHYLLKVIPLPQVFIPNVFTPNSDNQYDELVIEYGELSDISLKIYDRWGTIVFETTDRTSHWNGKNTLGNNAPNDVYYYQLTGKDKNNKKQYYKGNVTLMR